MSSIDYDDEGSVVDSEEEREGVLSMAGPITPVQSKPSTIQTADTKTNTNPSHIVPITESSSISSISTFAQQKISDPSISSFTTNEQSVIDHSTTRSRPRPRPRPAYKSANNSIDVSVTTSIDSPAAPLFELPADLAAHASSSSLQIDEIDASSFESFIRDQTANRSTNTSSALEQDTSVKSKVPVEIIELLSDGSDDDLRLRPKKRRSQANSEPHSDLQHTLSLSPRPPSPAGPSSPQPLSSPGTKRKRRSDDPPQFFASSSPLDLSIYSPLYESTHKQAKKSAKAAKKTKQLSDDAATPSTGLESKVKAKKSPRDKTKSSKKSKAKSKDGDSVSIEPAPVAEKVQYKSREFIEDSDEEALAGQPGGHVAVTATAQAVPPNPESELILARLAEDARDKDTKTRKSNSNIKKKKKSDKKSADVAKDVAENKDEDEETLRPKKKGTKKGKRVVESDDEPEPGLEAAPVPESGVLQGKGSEAATGTPSQEAKPSSPAGPAQAHAPTTPLAGATNLVRQEPRPSAKRLGPRAHTIGSRLTPMSELIRRASTHGSSPFPPGSYSPMLKSSRSLLARIAPLHVCRRTPPPPPPRAPPPKKGKRQLALEEKWEEELSESVEGWSAMTDGERAELRKAKWDMEMGEYD